MDYSSTLHDFVDGVLDKSQEKELFEALASDGGLRSEMKEFIEFEKLAQFDGAAFTPSAAVTDSLFANLGISGAATAGAAIAAKTGLWQSLLSHSSSILSTILAATVGAVAVFFLMPKGTGGNSENINMSGQTTVAASEVIVNRDEYMNLKQDATEIEQLKTKLANLSAKKNQILVEYIDRIVTREVPVYIVSKISEKQSLSLSPLILSADNSKFLSEKSSTVREPSIIFVPVTSSLTQNIDSEPAPARKTYESIGLSVEFQGGQYISMKNAGIAQSEQPLFNNSGISIAYELISDLSLVFDYRQEFFYQEYTGYEDDGILYSYKQYPNFSSFGLGIRYKIVDWEYLSLNSQLMLSLAPENGSWIYRGFAGGEFKVSDNMGILVGVELNGMKYLHEDSFGSTTNDITGSIGMKYGIIWHF